MSVLGASAISAPIACRAPVRRTVAARASAFASRASLPGALAARLPAKKAARGFAVVANAAPPAPPPGDALPPPAAFNVRLPRVPHRPRPLRERRESTARVIARERRGGFFSVLSILRRVR